MILVYDENAPRMMGGFRSLANANATAIYLTHFQNKLYLNFIAMNSDIHEEKAQANKELLICERKLTFWARHPNYEQSVVTEEIARLKKLYEREKRK
jgi:hypothetical protein